MLVGDLAVIDSHASIYSLICSGLWTMCLNGLACSHGLTLSRRVTGCTRPNLKKTLFRAGRRGSLERPLRQARLCAPDRGFRYFCSGAILPSRHTIGFCCLLQRKAGIPDRGYRSMRTYPPALPQAIRTCLFGQARYGFFVARPAARVRRTLSYPDIYPFRFWAGSP